MGLVVSMTGYGRGEARGARTVLIAEVTRQRHRAPPAERRVGAGHLRRDARGTARQSRRRPGGVGLDCGMENPKR